MTDDARIIAGEEAPEDREVDGSLRPQRSRTVAG